MFKRCVREVKMVFQGSFEEVSRVFKNISRYIIIIISWNVRTPMITLLPGIICIKSISDISIEDS